MKCPFCKGEIELTVEDDEGNIHPYEYQDDPYSGLKFSLKHPYSDNCKMSTKRYGQVFDTEDEARESYLRFKEDVEYLDEIADTEDYGDLDPCSITNAAWSVMLFLIDWSDDSW